MSGTQEPLTITVEAKDVSPGDWVVPEGIVKRVDKNGRLVLVFESDVRILDSTEKVEVRLEDRGEEEETEDEVENEEN